MHEVERAIEGTTHEFMRELSPQNDRPLSALNLTLVSVAVGVVAGLGAALFRAMIGLIHNLLFLGKFDLFYDANSHTPAGPWGSFTVLVPVVGALGVVFLVKNFAPEAKGHGVPEVMDAVYYKKGVIRPVVAAVKSLASALSIGSGGSVGREGPIIQIGSSFGSTVAQLLHLPTWQRITLIAAGAGGGIAATFNTPIGGILFAVEIIIHEVSVRTMLPVMMSTAVATYVGDLFFGSSPSFVIPRLHSNYFLSTQPITLLTYVGLGVLTGVLSVLYIKFIYGAEDFFESRVRIGDYGRHLLGMLLVGAVMTVMMQQTGHYYTQGVGYATVQDVLNGTLTRWDLLLLLFVLKLLVTSITLGSGASGGVFSPALFLGATLGGIYANFLHSIAPELPISSTAFAVAGMAGAVGGSTGAVLAAITMIFEMTLDYDVIIPMTITVAVAYGIRKALCEESIYTLKLARRGHHVPDALQTNITYVSQAGAAMNTDFECLPAEMKVKDLLAARAAQPDGTNYFVVNEDNRPVGLLKLSELLVNHSAEDKALGEVALTNFVTAPANELLFHLVSRLRAEKAHAAVVVSVEDENRLVGLIFKEQLADVWLKSYEFFAD